MFKIVRLALTMIIICGIIYPLAMTGLGQLLFPTQANGSIVKNEKGEAVGSELIGQNFEQPGYFHGRISSIKYDAAASGSNNYAPSNPDMQKRVEESIQAYKKEQPNLQTRDIPVDLITNSGSGLDPHISVTAAEFQIERVSKETGIATEQLKAAIKKATEKRSLLLFGEPRVNVLALNMNVQQLMR